MSEKAVTFEKVARFCEMCGKKDVVTFSTRLHRTASCSECHPEKPTIPITPLGLFVQRNVTGRRLHKWLGYLDIYEKHLQKFVGKSPVVLEIGVCHGGGLDMWKSYFGEGARVVGMDLNPAWNPCDEDQIYIGDQADPAFLKNVFDQVGMFDIIIDDGGHTMNQQITSFRALYEYVMPGGVYITEDLHTSHIRSFQDREDGKTFYDEIKRAAMELSTWHSPAGASPIARTTHGIHCYESIVVFEKAQMKPPFEICSGVELVVTEED